MTQEITTIESSTAVTPMEMLNRAVESGASVETMAQLMTLQERWEATQARKAFDAAIAQAKEEIPLIIKNKEVDFTSSKGRTHYKHEDLGQIAKVVTPILAKYGLSYRFRTSSGVNEPVGVTCIISHRDGHSEENSLNAPKDDTGNKNNIQGVGSTITYLQRYTLKAALGLAAAEDDDGKKAEESPAITQEQSAQLQALIDDTETDIETFCKYFQTNSVAELPSDKFAQALKKLELTKSERAKQND